MNKIISQFCKSTGVCGSMLGRIMTVSNRKMHRAVLKELGGSECILEIGFGTGSQLEMISRSYPGAELFGIDISEDMLKAARKRLNRKAKLSLCDCAKTDFQDGSFDAVITTDTCYFWQDSQRVLTEIKRITKPGGRLILAYNSMYAGSVRKSAGTAMYSDETITSEITRAGMTLLKKRCCGFAHLFHPGQD